MKDIRPWKKTGLLVFAAALGGIISVPGTGLLTARATVAVQASPVTEYDEAALASFADDTLESQDWWNGITVLTRNSWTSSIIIREAPQDSQRTSF